MSIKMGQSGFKETKAVLNLLKLIEKYKKYVIDLKGKDWTAVGELYIKGQTNKRKYARRI